MAAANPNPKLVTDQLWWFWLQFKAFEPHCVLGGIYCNKPGYHNTFNANKARDYSVLSAVDRRGAHDKASAIDITFPDAQAGRYTTITKYSKRLLASGRDLKDERGNYLRSFYGNADGNRVVDGWDYQRIGRASSDNSHLWHIHISFSRGYVANYKAMRAVLSILKGEPVKTWRLREAALLRRKPQPKSAVKVPAPVHSPPPLPPVPLPAPEPDLPPPPLPPPLPPEPLPAPLPPSEMDELDAILADAEPSVASRLRVWLTSLLHRGD